MTGSAKYPLLYQLNTRISDDIRDDILDVIRFHRFDWIYLLGVWKTGDAGRMVSRNHPAWIDSYRNHLPDFQPEDVCGSPFAVREYSVDDRLGGAEALKQLRKDLNGKGIRLMLDFVPNHTAQDHPWVINNPDFYISASENDLLGQPENYSAIETGGERKIFAFGRDPYFPGWPDTFQLNYGNPRLRQAMLDQLLEISDQCDGLRVDMAMLIVPEVFERTWGIRPEPFWPEAIKMVKERHPGFCFLAEVYWEMEWELQQMGFDFTYDKRLYDRLLEGHFQPVADHLKAETSFQDRLCRFLENHDEDRIASLLLPEQHKAAALIAYLAPGMRFLHDGQPEGRKIKTSIHLCRRAREKEDARVKEFYRDLLGVLDQPALKDGIWHRIDFRDDRRFAGDIDCLIGYEWTGADGQALMALINFCAKACKVSATLEHQSRIPEVILGNPKSFPVEGRSFSDTLKCIQIELPPWGFLVLKA